MANATFKASIMTPGVVNYLQLCKSLITGQNYAKQISRLCLCAHHPQNDGFVVLRLYGK